VVDLYQPGLEIVDPTEEYVSVLVIGRHPGELGAEESEVTGERGELLDRPVVQVKSKSRDAPLARFDEASFVLGTTLEQRLPFDGCRERGGQLFGKGECPLPVFGSRPDHDGREGVLPAQHRHRVDESVAVGSGLRGILQGLTRLRSNTPRRRAVSDVDHTP
jgi:hypothetical protein